MKLLDVNVLLYAHREDAERHEEYRDWLTDLYASPSTFAITDAVLASCLRILTHRRIFRPPTPFATAVQFAEQVRSRPNCITMQPGSRHWEIFLDLCHRAEARANLIPDAWLAAIAIESGSDLITTDRDFARFPNLRWRHPLD